MKTLLTDRLLGAGLIQFGWFEHAETVKPFAFKLDMLASYPDLLLRSAHALIRLIGENPITHLLTPTATIGLGTAIALEMSTPLVYQRIESAVDLVGAYDIGHPAALILDVFDRQHPPTTLIAYARRVGLNIQDAYCLIDIENGANPLDLHVWSMTTLREIVTRAAENEQIPPGQADAVREWINFG